MREFTPAPGHVLICPQDQVKGLSGIPAPDKDRKGKVIAVGEDTRFNSGDVMTSPCKIGDYVYHTHQYEGDILLQGKKHKILRFESILGVYGK